MKKTYFLIGLLAFFTHNFAFGQVVKNGVADLSDIRWEDGPVSLYGKWEFYRNSLLTPEDFNKSQHPEFIFVPGSWHRQIDYPVLGYATYRMKAKLPPNAHGLSLYFPVLNSSAKIWLNGKFADEIGKVSDRPETFSPELASTIVPIPDGVEEIEIVVQVANFWYFSSGFPRTPQIDLSVSHFLRTSRSNGIENFFAGSLIAMCIYQLILYFLYHRGKPYLWLSLICLGVALRAMIVHGGSFLLPNLFPSVAPEIWKKIEFGSVYAIVAIFPLYVYHLFIGHSPKWPMYLFIGVASVLGVAVIFTPQHVYGRLLEVSHIGLLFAFGYAIYSIAKAWRAGNRDARIIFFGVLASFPFILMEILKNSMLFPVNIPLVYLVELGVLVFLLFQVYLLANHYAKSYKNLEVMNHDLEQMVKVRTVELTTANTVKDRLLSVMSHDIKSPLNSLRGILQIYNAGVISKDEFDQFSKHIEDDLGKTSILVDNILHWTTGQLKGIKVKRENFNLNQVISEITQLFQTIAGRKNIALNFSVAGDGMVYSDKNIIYLVLRNLISNAIKFSKEGANIDVRSSVEESVLRIEVSDQGVGMDRETVEMLMNPENLVSTPGTGNEKGTGLGLTLCLEYLEKIGGKLIVTSEKGKGSTFIAQIDLACESVSLAK